MNGIEIEGLLFDQSGKAEPTCLSIGRPYPSGIEGEHYCDVSWPPLLNSEKRIYGGDAEQAWSLAVEFCQALVADHRFVDQSGKDVTFR